MQEFQKMLSNNSRIRKLPSVGQELKEFKSVYEAPKTVQVYFESTTLLEDVFDTTERYFVCNR